MTVKKPLTPRTKREVQLYQFGHQLGYDAGVVHGKHLGRAQAEADFSEKYKVLNSDRAKLQGAVQLGKALADLLSAAGIETWSRGR